MPDRGAEQGGAVGQRQVQLAALDDEPGSTPAATDEAVARWRDAVNSGNVAAQRSLIKRTLPKITSSRQRARGDHSAERIKFDGLPRSVTAS